MYRVPSGEHLPSGEQTGNGKFLSFSFVSTTPFKDYETRVARATLIPSS